MSNQLLLRLLLQRCIVGVGGCLNLTCVAATRCKNDSDGGAAEEGEGEEEEDKLNAEG